MSQAYRKRQKAKKSARTAEERELRNRIRKGILPAVHLAMGKNMKPETAPVFTGRYNVIPQEDKTFKREPIMREKRTWRQVSTLRSLLAKTEKEPQS